MRCWLSEESKLANRAVVREAAYGPKCNRDPLFYYTPHTACEGGQQQSVFVDCFPAFQALFCEDVPEGQRRFTGECAVNEFLVEHWKTVARSRGLKLWQATRSDTYVDEERAGAEGPRGLGADCQGAFSGQWTCKSYHIVIWDDEPRFTAAEGDDLAGIFIGRHVYWFTGKGYTLAIVAAGTFGRLFRPFFWELFGWEPSHRRLPEQWYTGFSFIRGATPDTTLLHRWQICLAQLVYTYDKSTPELKNEPYNVDWIVGQSRPHGSKALLQLALRVRRGDLSHLQHNEFGVPRDSFRYTSVIGFVEASVTGSLRRPHELNRQASGFGSVWIYPPTPIIGGREQPSDEEPIESKAADSEYEVAPEEAGSEQAGGFECLKSDSGEDDEQGGGISEPERPISIPSDCVAQIAILDSGASQTYVAHPLRRVTSDAHGRPSRAEFWAYRRRAQYPARVTCLVCEVQVSGRENWLAHLNGKKHAKKLQRRATAGTIYWDSVCEVCGLELEPCRQCIEVHYRIVHDIARFLVDDFHCYHR